MIRSMTGFGKATGTVDGAEVSVELSTVNHRYLDCSVRAPYAWAALETPLRETVKKYLSRGKVSMMVSRKRGTTTRQVVRFDEALATQYAEAGKQLSDMLGTDQGLSPDVVAQFDGVFYEEECQEDLEATQKAVVEILRNALDKLQETRAIEGKALAEDVAAHLGEMRTCLARVEARLPELTKLYEERLRSRIRDLNEEANCTEERLAVEVTLWADKSDVAEEVARLKAHFDRFDELLAAKEPIGRDMNFLSQEVQRETNTLGVKVRDTEVTNDVLLMKSELEKIREQIQNIE